jgi:uncharacterized protein YcbX
MVEITSLHIYPVKSCRGVSLERALITPTGFEHDRQWLIAREDGRFITQREEPRLALIETALTPEGLTLRRKDGAALDVPFARRGREVQVVCWKDRCAAFDEGEEAARWLSEFIGKPLRLARFDPRGRRPSDPQWTGGVETLNQFSDGFPWLLISQASLDDLNSRLDSPLPMNRFRPNIVVSGLAPYGEDSVSEFVSDGVRLKPVKACARCAIPATDQDAGVRSGDEPMRTLKQYRYNRMVQGVAFGQNLIALEGFGRSLHVGQTMRAIHSEA